MRKKITFARADWVRTVLSPGRGPGWKLGLGVMMIVRDSMIRFGRLPMCQGWTSRLFLLRIDSWRKNEVVNTELCESQQ